MNILVSGANGQLGREMRIVSNESTDHWHFTDTVSDNNLQTKILDITDINTVRQYVLREKISCIVNCAAYTNVDKAESEPLLCSKLNTDAVENLAKMMKQVNGLLVHISTDYVFGGDSYNTPCKEERKGTPTGVYGKTKLLGEEVIKEVGCEHIIIRTAWLYSEFGKNFVKTMLNLTATKPELKVVFDQCGTPTYALDLAETIYKIVSERRFEGNSGIYHYSNEGVCSWFDFTKMIAEYARHTACNIQPCHSSEFPSLVKRPAYSVLDKTKIKQTFGLTVPYWTDSLRKCIANLTNQY